MASQLDLRKIRGENFGLQHEDEADNYESPTDSRSPPEFFRSVASTGPCVFDTVELTDRFETICPDTKRRTASFNTVAHEGTAVADDRERWNEKYSDDDEFELPADPIPELARRIDTLPGDRALDVATGTGRNAIYLAEHGYDVEGIDVSDEALKRAERRAEKAGVDVEWIRADLTDPGFDLEADAYDVITVSFFAALGLLPDLKEALAPGGVLVYEHHLRSSDPIEIGPSSDRHRYRSNDLLRACLDLTILSYEERRRQVNDGVAAVATLVARSSVGGSQSYPELPETR